jgi:hypothetical protein
MEFLRRLTYRREVITAARLLGLRSILRKWHYWWVRLPADVGPETVGDLLTSVRFSGIDTDPRWDRTLHHVAYKGASLAG